MASAPSAALAWHDYVRPTKEELLSVQRRYHFHKLDIDDCLSDHERPKLEEYVSYLFLVFHIPYINTQTGRIHREEINIFLGSDFLVTIRDGNIPIPDALRKSLKHSRKKYDEYCAHGVGFFLYKFLHDLFFGGFSIVENFMRELRRIEEAFFTSEEQRGVLQSILTLRRNIITMRSILYPQRSILALLE